MSQPHTPLNLRHLAASRRGMWALAWLLGMLTLLATVGLLALSGWFISAAALAGMLSLASAYTFNYFGPAAIIRLFAIVRTAGRYGERLASHHAALGLLADLRNRLFANLAAASAHSASIRQMHRLTSDIDLLNEYPLRLLLPWLWAQMLLALFALLLWLVSPILLVWLLPPLLAAAVLLPLWAAARGVRLAAAQTAQAESRRQALLQPLTALTALLQWQQWPRFQAAFTDADGAYATLWQRQQNQTAQTVLWQQLCLALAAAVLLWQGAVAVEQGHISVPLLLALLLALFGLVEVMLPLGMQMMAYGFSRAACQRLNDLSCENAATMANGIQPLPAQLHLQAQQLCAKQTGALNGAENINFDVRNGEVLWIRGASGAGKSTLLQVLAGELLPQNGKLLLNGQPLQHWQWQGQIGYLAQNVDIFDLTLAQNLRLGKADASDEELWAALDKVALADWARAQPQGLHTTLGEYGAAVSGGQARRIALARLLLRPYRILLLDEPFAGVGDDYYGKIEENLVNFHFNGILVVVSHYAFGFLRENHKLLRYSI
ncbi:amino acid ABC transporter ATP-binding/permease protein [Paralysiella testudinis]|uniref:ATP-binding cassette domain-containing protein n=1 Tax=Paralysiella testudinis TaxID=2809020 RepID=A0A892ZKN7_9NEIS|nr:ATP-binding cassette domain-containing protein [Paralysiella testudinis]QRQ82978.1 ATP-binding cassette domain-containing protein [Paralysiella testudinis]